MKKYTFKERQSQQPSCLRQVCADGLEVTGCIVRCGSLC